MSEKHDLLVIGAGPGGYVAAIRAAQLGFNTACVDENAAFGGTCLRVGCIPSKALLESSHVFEEAQNHLGPHGVKVGGVELDLKAMLKRKDRVVKTLTGGVKSLLKKNEVTQYQGRASFEGPGKVRIKNGEGEGQVVEAERVLIATGSQPAELPGVEYDGDRVGTSTEALSYPEVPKRLVVIGAGYIGLELGSVWRRLGAEVTVLEYLDRALPGMDEELGEQARKFLEKQGLKFRFGTKVTAARAEKGKCVVEIEGEEPIECDRVLTAVGRKPNTAGLNLATVGIELDEGGRVPVGEGFATSAEGVYAVGDVIAGPMLAHKASEEGVACVEGIAEGYGHVNYEAIPGVVYTHPEIASVGQTEQALREAGVEYRKGSFPFVANGRARTLNDTDGWVKVLADKATDRVLGVHIIGPRAGDLIAEAAAAIDYGASSEDIGRTPHAHPTLAESLKEAALAVDERPLHI